MRLHIFAHEGLQPYQKLVGPKKLDRESLTLHYKSNKPININTTISPTFTPPHHPASQAHDWFVIAPTVWAGSHAEHAAPHIFLIFYIFIENPKAESRKFRNLGLDLCSLCSYPSQGGNNTNSHPTTHIHDWSVIASTVWLRSYASPRRTPPPPFFLFVQRNRQQTRHQIKPNVHHCHHCHHCHAFQIYSYPCDGQPGWLQQI